MNIIGDFDFFYRYAFDNTVYAIWEMEVQSSMLDHVGLLVLNQRATNL